jgi:hypothetical protein
MIRVSSIRQNIFYFILFYSSPTITTANESTTKKSRKRIHFFNMFFIVFKFQIQAHLLDIPTGNNAWSSVLQQAERRRRKRRQTTPEHPRRALFCLTLDNKLRRSCIKLVEWKYVFKLYIDAFLYVYNFF